MEIVHLVELEIFVNANMNRNLLAPTGALVVMMRWYRYVQPSYNFQILSIYANIYGVQYLCQ